MEKPSLIQYQRPRSHSDWTALRCAPQAANGCVVACQLLRIASISASGPSIPQTSESPHSGCLGLTQP